MSSANSSDHKIDQNEDKIEGLPYLIKRCIPIVLASVLILLLWLFFNIGCKKSGLPTNSERAELRSTELSNMDLSLDSEEVAAKNDWEARLGKNRNVKLPNGVVIGVPENGIERKLIDFLNNSCPGDVKKNWFNMDRLLYENGSSKLSAVSMAQITNLSEIFKSYSDATFKIGGYTDNSGSEETNKALSGDRAYSAMKAIIDQGIEANRLESEGYGADYFICPANNTDECRAKNRRIAIRVTRCK